MRGKEGQIDPAARRTEASNGEGVRKRALRGNAIITAGKTEARAERRVAGHRPVHDCHKAVSRWFRAHVGPRVARWPISCTPLLISARLGA